MSNLSIKRQNAWVSGLVCRIERFNEGKPWNQQIEVPTIAETEDGPFIILDSWEQARKLAEVAGLKSRYPKYPDFDDRVQSGFSDEYTTCSDCNALIRTSPDSYSWQPDFIVDDCGIHCAQYVQDNPEDTIDAVKNTDTPLPVSIDPEAHGWVRLNKQSLESGFFPGQTDNPETYRRALTNAGVDYLFRIDEPSQFYTRWSVWVPEDQLENVPFSISPQCWPDSFRPQLRVNPVT